AGDGDDGEFAFGAQTFDAVLGQLAQRLGGIGHDDGRQGRVIDGRHGFADDQGRTRLDGGRGELDSVEALTSAGNVDVAESDVSRIRHHTSGQGGRGVDAVQLTIDGGCDLGCSQSLHINCELYLVVRRPAAWTALSVSWPGRRIRSPSCPRSVLSHAPFPRSARWKRPLPPRSPRRWPGPGRAPQ